MQIVDINRAQAEKRPAAALKLITSMNRWAITDSKLSLDVLLQSRDSLRMMIETCELYIERIEPDRNMARFYRLRFELDLFGNTLLIRHWGRIGSKGREKLHAFSDEREALALFLGLLRQKRHRGYRTPQCQVK